MIMFRGRGFFFRIMNAEGTFRCYASRWPQAVRRANRKRGEYIETHHDGYKSGLGYGPQPERWERLYAPYTV